MKLYTYVYVDKYLKLHQAYRFLLKSIPADMVAPCNPTLPSKSSISAATAGSPMYAVRTAEIFYFFVAFPLNYLI